MGCMVNCLFISKVRFLVISVVGEVDECDKMMLRNNYELRTKYMSTNLKIH